MKLTSVAAWIVASLLAGLPPVALAAEGQGPDRQAACSAARALARKEAGKKVQLGDCKCDQNRKPDAPWVCSVDPQ